MSTLSFVISDIKEHPEQPLNFHPSLRSLRQRDRVTLGTIFN